MPVFMSVIQRQGGKRNQHCGNTVQPYLQLGLCRLVCATLADTIIFVEMLPASNVKAHLPTLNNALAESVSVLAAGKHPFLLSVMKVRHSPRLFVSSRASCREYPHVE